MRYALLFALCTLACAAEPVLLPDASTPDAGPCGGACGAGTVCVSGACVAVDAGSPVDAGALDAGPVDVGEDRPAPVDMGTDTGPVDVGVDAGPMDVLPTGCASTTSGNCCGVACPTTAHGVAACLGGRCGVASCEANYGDCDGNPANGCETDTRTTAAHCGACGAACARGRVCTGSACAECPPGPALCDGLCAAGYGNCDGLAVNGCETNLMTSWAACGSCGHVCSRPAHGTVDCVNGTCRVTCSGQYGANCDGTCVDSLSDPRNCNACGRVCDGGVCASGSCR